MKWVRMSDYHIRAGEYTICKAFMEGGTRYTVSRGTSKSRNLELLKSFDTLAQAKAYVSTCHNPINRTESACNMIYAGVDS